MYKNKTFLAIIPARSGSKRLPNKNILNLVGRPLITYTIEAAKNSKYIDDIIVTSDSNNILEIAKDYNVMSIKRPDYLASDTAKTIDVVIHAIYNLNKKYDYIILLQPTSPLRNEKHIDEAIELLDKKNADAIISVCETEHSPLWSNTLADDMSMKNFLKEEVKNKRTQDLPKFYRLNGAIYICKFDNLINEHTFFIKDKIYAYVMEQKYSIDIDNLIDFKLAELLIKENNEKL